MATSNPTLDSPSPRALLGFFAAKFRTEIAVQFAYRGAIAIWLLALVSFPVISLVVWTTVARSNGGSAGGFTTGQYAAYFIAVMVVNNMTFIWHMWQMEWRVKNGFFSPVLLRPMHPIHNDVVENLTFKSLTFTALLPIAILLAVYFDADFGTSAGDAVAFVPVLIGAMAVRFVCEWTLGLSAFWITRTSTLSQLYGTMTAFLAGMIAPLSLFPEPVRIIASILPFRWMVSFPVEVLLGRVDGEGLLIGLGMQVLWIAIAVLALRVVWRRGVRRYSAVGA
ncbi:MAG TPA: ABC-2 family transporter protein [Thermomicrobiales bacterium]|nr:ABC-2 family transporter protein [Thermomicrobiales bacterium]